MEKIANYLLFLAISVRPYFTLEIRVMQSLCIHFGYQMAEIFWKHLRNTA